MYINYICFFDLYSVIWNCKGRVSSFPTRVCTLCFTSVFKMLLLILSGLVFPQAFQSHVK